MKNRILLAILAGVLVAGCSSMSSTGGDAGKAKYQVIATGEPQDRLKVLNAGVSKTGDLAKGNIELKNDSNFDIQFQYRFKWYDGSGAELNPEGSSWIPASMMAQETKSLQSVAPNPAGETFKIFLQDKP